MTTSPPPRQRLIIEATTRPQLKRHIRLHTPPGTGQTVLLAPEKVLTPNAQALAVLGLCDGERTVAEVSAALAERYNAPSETIQADVIEVLQNLADDGLLHA